MAGAVRPFIPPSGSLLADNYTVWGHVAQEPGKKPDYVSQTAKELASIQHRILMLNEMLDNLKPNERFAEGDAFDVRLAHSPLS